MNICCEQWLCQQPQVRTPSSHSLWKVTPEITSSGSSLSSWSSPSSSFHYRHRHGADQLFRCIVTYHRGVCVGAGCWSDNPSKNMVLLVLSKIIIFWKRPDVAAQKTIMLCKTISRNISTLTTKTVCQNQAKKVDVDTLCHFQFRIITSGVPI